MSALLVGTLLILVGLAVAGCGQSGGQPEPGGDPTPDPATVE